MALHKWDQHAVATTVYSEHDRVADRRLEIAAREAAEDERKREELFQQSAATNSAEMRIRIWERRHGLALPRDPDHPLLQRVARATGLSVADIQEEQRQRLTAAAERRPEAP